MLSRLPLIRYNSAAKSVTAFFNSKSQVFNYPEVNQFIKCRNMSIENSTGDLTRNLNFEQLLEKKKEPNTVLIDVREHSEINETGKLPGSIHIPLNELEKALNMSSDDFNTAYKAVKPDHNTQIIFSCRSGKRIKDIPHALGKMTPEEFSKKYNAPHPGKDAQVIFSCRSGNRSRKALNEALKLGYQKAAHYKGGWLDWVENMKNKS